MDPQGAAKDKTWLHENCKRLAAFAANSFREKGKGAVMVHNPTPGQIFYLPEAEIASDDPDTGHMVREYDSSQEFVVLIIHPGINSSYRLRCP
jgi:hypothetical protein